MRIRTIKPEFWTHPKISRLNDFTKLIAIGLLNHADDYGYFNADHLVVRSSIMPFSEDSVSIHGALSELSNIGYISIIECPDFGKIGKVENFEKHQRVNRPTPSKLGAYYNSVRTHGGLSEGSLLEGKGREQGKEGNGVVGLEHVQPHAAPLSIILDHFKSSGFTKDEIEAVWRSFEASKFNGKWKWGKGVVMDWRNAMHSRLSERKMDRDARKPSNNKTEMQSARIEEKIEIKELVL